MLLLSEILNTLRLSRGWTRDQTADKITDWIERRDDRSEINASKGDPTKLFRVEKGMLTSKDLWLTKAIAEIFGEEGLEGLLRKSHENELSSPSPASMTESEYAEQLNGLLNKSGHTYTAWLFLAESPPIMSSDSIQRAWWKNIENGIDYNLCWVPGASDPKSASMIGRFLAKQLINRNPERGGPVVRHYLLPAGKNKKSLDDYDKLRSTLELHVREIESANSDGVKFFAMSKEGTDVEAEARVESLLYASPLGQAALFRNDSMYRSFASFAITKAVAEPDDSNLRVTFHWLDGSIVERLYNLSERIKKIFADIKK